MEHEVLRRFNGDLAAKESLLAFIGSVIDEEALKRVYKGESTTAMADAKSFINKAFNKLDEIYGVKQPKRKQRNQAI